MQFPCANRFTPVQETDGADSYRVPSSTEAWRDIFANPNHTYRATNPLDKDLFPRESVAWSEPVPTRIVSATIHSRGRDSCSGLVLPAARF